MSVQTELNRILDLKNNIRTKLNSLGVLNNADANLSQCNTALQTIDKYTGSTTVTEKGVLSVGGKYVPSDISIDISSTGMYVWEKRLLSLNISNSISDIMDISDQIEGEKVNIYEKIELDASNKIVGTGNSTEFNLIYMGEIPVTQKEYPYLIENNNAYTEVTTNKRGTFLVGKIVTFQKSETPTYVTSDNPTEYPDGAEKDGCWYKKTSVGVGSFKKVSSGSFMLSTDTDVHGYTIEHGLGVIPKYAYIYTDDDTPQYTYTVVSETFDANIKNYERTFYAGRRTSFGSPSEYAGRTLGTLDDSLTGDKIILQKPWNTTGSSDTNIYNYDWKLAAGITYHWIALA